MAHGHTLPYFSKEKYIDFFTYLLQITQVHKHASCYQKNPGKIRDKLIVVYFGWPLSDVCYVKVTPNYTIGKKSYNSKLN